MSLRDRNDFCNSDPGRKIQRQVTHWPTNGEGRHLIADVVEYWIDHVQVADPVEAERLWNQASRWAPFPTGWAVVPA